MTPTLPELDDYSPALIGIARARLAIITPLLALAARQRTHEAVSSYLATTALLVLGKPVSVATVYRWIAAYTAQGHDLRALLPRTADRGGKQQTRQSAEVEQIIQAALTERYLVRERVTIDDIWHEVAAWIATANAQRLPTSPLALPSRRTIARRIAAIPPSERRRAKEGAAQARHAVRQFQQTPYPDQPLARVEIDHLRLDLMTVDDQDTFPLGRLTLTYCLDTATCYPLGYFLSFEPPSYWSVMECLYHAILPKPRTDTNHPWLAHGLPETLVVDHGKEFVGQDLADACSLLGITLQPAPVHTPEFKGRIERQFRRLNDQLVHTLPGTTFASVRARSDYASLHAACLTLAEVDQLFTGYMVDIYAQSYHRGLAGIPARRWETLTMADDWCPRVPPDPALLALYLCRTAQRCVHHYGIELFGLHYNTPELGPLRDRLSHAPAKIKYHPGNLGSIAVYDPDEHRYLPVPALADAYATGLPLWQHQVIKRFARLEAQSVDIVALGQAKHRFQDVVAAARSRTQRTRKLVARTTTPRTATHQPFVASSVTPWTSAIEVDATAWRIERPGWEE